MLYFKHRNADELTAELKNRLENTNARIKAWQDVKIKHKKDGAEFVNLAQAIKGAKLLFNTFHFPNIFVYYRNNCGYTDDFLNAYFYCDELPDNGASRATVYGGGIIRKISPQTAQELRETIQKHIEKLKEQAETYKKQIAIAEKAFLKYRKAIEKADKELKEICNTTKRPDDIGETTLYYEITRLNQ